MIYLATPYSHPDADVRQHRYEKAVEYAARLMSRGEQVYSPIAHSHPIAVKAELPMGYDYWEQFDRWFIERCESVLVVMLDGWKESKGIAAEIEYAKELGKPVRYTHEIKSR